MHDFIISPPSLGEVRLGGFGLLNISRIGFLGFFSLAYLLSCTDLIYYSV